MTQTAKTNINELRELSVRVQLEHCDSVSMPNCCNLIVVPFEAKQSPVILSNNPRLSRTIQAKSQFSQGIGSVMKLMNHKFRKYIFRSKFL